MFNLFDPVGSKKPIHWTYTNSGNFALKVMVRQTVFGIEKAEILFVMQVEGEFRLMGGTRANIGGEEK